MTPHTAPPPPPGVDIEAEAEKLCEAVAPVVLESQLAQAQEGGGDAGHGEAAAGARADAEGEAGRGDMESATRPDVGTGKGGVDAAAHSEVGRGGAGGDAQERPASQGKGETPTPEPSRAGVEGDTAVESAPGAPEMGDTRVSEPAGVEDQGAAAAVAAQTALGNAEPVGELLSSSDEYADSGDIVPAAATAPPAGSSSSSRLPRRSSAWRCTRSSATKGIVTRVTGRLFGLESPRGLPTPREEEAATGGPMLSSQILPTPSGRKATPGATT